MWGPGPKGGTALTGDKLKNAVYQMSFKYGTATKATREIPVLKYAKKLGNHVLNGLKYLRDGVYWDYKEVSLRYPQDNLEDDADVRPYVREVRLVFVQLFWSELRISQLTILTLSPEILV